MSVFSYMNREPGFYRQVAALAAPIVLQNLITSMLGMADTFMVGLLGEVPMAAVTLANVPLFVVHLFIFGVQSGASILISQYWGREDRESINRVLGMAMWVAGTISFLFALVLQLWPVEFLSLFGNERAVILEAARYGRFVGWSYACVALTMMYITTYRSMERPRLGMYILVGSMVLNTFLNWVLIFGKLGAPAMGVAGAGLATLISRMLELTIVAVHMSLTKFFRVRPRLLLLPGKDMARRFLRYGSPVVLNETLWGLGSSVYPAIMGHMDNSTEILAAYTVAGNVDKICMVVSFGISATAAVIIGREVGAGRPQKVRDMGMALSTLALLCGAGIGAVLLLFARIVAPAWVYPLFQMSARAGAVATMMMTVHAFIRPLRDFNGVSIMGVLRGGGDVKMATLIDIIPLWGVAIPAAVLCGAVLRMDILWVFLAMSLESIIKCGVGFRRMRSGKWIRDLTRAG